MKPKRYNREHELFARFGVVEYDDTFPDVPVRIGSSAYSRIEICKDICSWCFPHGMEVPNYTREHRSWKSHRKAQWKEKKHV